MQALEEAPTVSDTVTPAGEHWLRPRESNTEYTAYTVLAPFSTELYTVEVLRMPPIRVGAGYVYETVVVAATLVLPIV